MRVTKIHHSSYSNSFNHPYIGDKKISLILPSRNEYETIGLYLSKFEDLFEKGYLHEIILADSSDNSLTINEFFSSAMSSKVFSNAIYSALKIGRPLPIKAVNVFDSNYSKLFGKKCTRPGKAPGKGRTMYAGMAVASGTHYVFLDTDFYNIDSHFIKGLIAPLVFDDARFVKATFEREDEWKTVLSSLQSKEASTKTNSLLMKSVNSRNIAHPLLNILQSSLLEYESISNFSGPLSGGYSADSKLWLDMCIPTRYGVEIYSLMDLVRQFNSTDSVYDVNLGVVEQTSADSAGQVLMAKNIIGSFFRYIQSNHPKYFSQILSNPDIFTLSYIQRAISLSVHVDDPKIVYTYAKIIRKKLDNPTLLNKTFILPPLNDNSYYLANKDMFPAFADTFSIERLEILGLINTKNNISADAEFLQEVKLT